MLVIYDDSGHVPAEVGALAGIVRFGRLIYQRRPLAQRFLEAAEAAGVDEIAHLKNEQDLQLLRDRVAQRPAARSYLYVPANLVSPASSPAAITAFIRKLRYAIPNLILAVPSAEEWTGVLLMDPTTCRGYLSALVDRNSTEFITAHDDGFSRLENTIGFVDLRDYATFLEYLTTNFEVRHFNSIQSGDAYTVCKHSSDREKLRGEYTYFGMLPEHLQRFFIQPFGFEESGTSVSYRMERVLLPDMAVQWIHGALTPDEFGRFLDQVFYFLAQRPCRPATAAEVRARADALYVQKLNRRIDALKSELFFPVLEGLLAAGGRRIALRELVDRFKRLYAEAKRPRRDELVIGHGDLGFSNILYGKSTRIMKLIDPRGAATVEDLFTDPYYDAAKLSHSILGGYDYINNGLFNVLVDGQLNLELQFEAADRSAEQDQFRAKLSQHGFDERLTRLYEASLFLSMLPLHADMPRKVIAFALTASKILDEVETL